MPEKKPPARKVEVRSPNAPDYRGRVDAAKHAAMQAILLKVIPSGPPGITQNEMFAAVQKAAPNGMFPASTSTWWAKTVQLDLEARGRLVRDAGAKPLRWRKA